MEGSFEEFFFFLQTSAQVRLDAQENQISKEKRNFSSFILTFFFIFLFEILIRRFNGGSHGVFDLGRKRGEMKQRSRSALSVSTFH